MNPSGFISISHGPSLTLTQYYIDEVPTVNVDYKRVTGKDASGADYDAYHCMADPDNCQKKFPIAGRSSSDVIRHVNEFHLGKAVECELCGNALSRSNLTQHQVCVILDINGTFIHVASRKRRSV